MSLDVVAFSNVLLLKEGIFSEGANPLSYATLRREAK